MKKSTISGKITALFLCALLISAISGFAIADVIWEPEDDFYMSHAEDCEFYGKGLYSNGESGYLEFFSKPEGVGIGFAKNGELFFSQFSYASNDETWFVVEFTRNGEHIAPPDYSGDIEFGWVKLSDTIEQYDSADFLEQFSADISSGEFTEDSLISMDIVAWTYPCSGEICEMIPDVDEALTFSNTYTDAEGRRWGHCNYYYGHRDFWVCLDDPTSESIPAVTQQELVFHQPNAETPPAATGNSVTMIIIICVAAVVILSASLIIALHKKNSADAQK